MMTSREDRLRADELLVSQGHAGTRSKAKAMILAGDIRIGDRVVDRPAELLPVNTEFSVARPPKYVSRGGFKLEHALREFNISVAGLIAADLGASTGGFTDCLLQHGAARVYAIDVGYGQLDYRLRKDARVVVMERTNARYLETLPEQVGIVTIDVSFISLAHVLNVATAILETQGILVALIKPQFEAGKGAVDRKGVVRDDLVRRRVVERVIVEAEQAGLGLLGLTRSPLVGPAGNEEFLGYFRKDTQGIDPEPLLSRVFGT
jgi:23S rRNA (cytidine1920-2'-O)/16S rRNA (cytidine1409-2'-O)-methyltransferase